MPFNVVLVEPEIPQNTGNILRTCAATGSSLHLVKPLGFRLEDKYLKRAGLDYWPLAELKVHENLDAFFVSCPPDSVFRFVSTKGGNHYTQLDYPGDCYLLFGRETQGLPAALLDSHPESTVRIPMVEAARSLNLSNAAAIVVYEALRQRGFPGLTSSKNRQGF